MPAKDFNVVLQYKSRKTTYVTVIAWAQVIFLSKCKWIYFRQITGTHVILHFCNSLAESFFVFIVECIIFNFGIILSK